MSSDSDSDSGNSSNSSRASSPGPVASPSPPPARKIGKKRYDDPRATKVAGDNHSKAKDKYKEKEKKSKEDKKSTSKGSRVLSPRDQCLHAARWIPRAYDMFCDLDEVVRVCLMLEEEEAIAEWKQDDTEQMQRKREKVLSKVDERTRKRYVEIFSYLKEQAPYLLELIEKNKRDKVNALVVDMQRNMNRARSDDVSHLRPCIGQYAAPYPLTKHLEPPIDAKGTKARMGFNHPEIARLLCPIRYLREFDDDVTETRKKLSDSRLPVTAQFYPTFLWEGIPAGRDFTPEEFDTGFLKGYLLERVTSHIFTSPSSALGTSNSRTPRASNSKIHGMKHVEAAHLAYAAVHARFALSPLDKFKEMDGAFSFSKFYYRLLAFIDENEDQEWTRSLTGHFNKLLFDNERGVLNGLNDEDAEEDDSMVMKRQIANRLRGSSTSHGRSETSETPQTASGSGSRRTPPSPPPARPRAPVTVERTPSPPPPVRPRAPPSPSPPPVRPRAPVTVERTPSPPPVRPRAPPPPSPPPVRPVIRESTPRPPTPPRVHPGPSVTCDRETPLRKRRRDSDEESDVLTDLSVLSDIEKQPKRKAKNLKSGKSSAPVQKRNTRSRK